MATATTASSVRRSRWADPASPLEPADRLLVAQSTTLIVLSSWGGGGWLPGVLPAMLVVALIGWLALWLRRRENQSLKLAAFLPLGLWLVLLAIALLNPSHTPAAAGGTWYPRQGWISWLPSTISRPATIEAELPWLIALSQAAILVATRIRRRAVRFIWTAAAVNGFLLAAIGAAFHFAGSEQMLGLIDTSEQYFFATFFYKNHWAAYGWLGAVAGGALTIHNTTLFSKGDPRAGGRAIFFGALALLTVVTLPLPGSRAGLALTALFVVGLPILLLLARRRSHTAWTRPQVAGGLIVLLIALGTIAFGLNAYADRAREDWDRTVRQLSVATSRSGEVPEIRLVISRDTWRMALARPWFGWGIGSYEYAFPLFQGNYLRDARGRPTARFEFAHNDWLQMFAEAGIVGLAVLLIPLGRIATRSWRNAGATGRTTLLGCAVLGLYAWIDFPLNNPSVLTLWTILLVTAGRVETPAKISEPATPA